MDKEKDKKKIVVGKDGKKSQIILNPPEITSPAPYKEAFLRALEKKRVVVEKKIEIVLNAKASQAHLPVDALEQVYIRGFKSLPLNSNLTREQYAMNRVNSFIAGGAAMVEDCDLLPIHEVLHTTVGLKGSGGAMRPHIKREKSPYNNKIVYHVVDAQGRVKHSTSDENEAKKHLATKYNSYMEMTLKPSKRFEGTNSLVKTYKTDTPGEKRGVTEEKMKGEDPCWKGYQMVGKKIKAGREVPNCVPKNEEVQPVNEISKELANRYYWSAKSSGDEMDKKISTKVKKLNDKWSQKTHNKLTDLLAKSQKRTAGRLRALDRLNKHEEVQPIEELSSEKLNKYIQRSTGEHGHYNMARRNTTGDQQKEFARKETKRAKGISQAFDKLDAKQKVTEATSAAIRMQRALDKIKADRERRERLAAPFVNSVFAKKAEDKKKEVKEGLADDILAAAKAKGLNAKIAPSLADRKKATAKLIKHRAKQTANNPPQARPYTGDTSMSSPSAYYRSKKPGEYTGD